jgi:hypothetical protein
LAIGDRQNPIGKWRLAKPTLFQYSMPIDAVFASCYGIDHRQKIASFQRRA